MSAAVNLWPIIKVIFFVALAGFCLVVIVFALFVLLMIVTAPFRVLSGNDYNGDDAAIVFWGGVLLVCALIFLAFKFHLVMLK